MTVKITEYIIKSVPVSLALEIQKTKSQGKIHGEPSFIEANWTHHDINFNLRSDGLSFDEAERVVASMIQ